MSMAPEPDLVPDDAAGDPRPADDVTVRAFGLLESHVDPDEPGSRPDVEALAGENEALARELRAQAQGLDVLAELLDRPGAGSAEPERVLQGKVEVPEGTRRVGAYSLLEKVEPSGNMGEVYRAVRPGLDRVVALKILPARFSLDPESVTCFRQEAFLAARIDHPFVARILDVGQEGRLWFYTMDWVEGRDLQLVLDTLRAAGTETVEERHLAVLAVPPVSGESSFSSVERRYVVRCAHLVGDVACGLQAAHRADVLHRDLKPANIVLTPDGTPRIVDFGLAARLDRPGEPIRMGAGTALYMPPEAFDRQGQARPDQDVYALGVLLYELTTLVRPFTGRTWSEVERAVREAAPVPPSRLRLEVDRELEGIIQKAMHVDPECRYASASALAEDLDRFVAGRTVAVAPPPPWRLWLRRLRRHPWRTAALVLAVVVVVETLVLLLG
jgi:eukaryotic-like serine/threonine-protein kinase